MTVSQLSLRDQRTLTWLSVVMAAVWGYAFVFLLRFFPPPSPALNAEQVVALYADHRLRFQIGVILMLITGAWFALQSAVVMAQMSREQRCTPVWRFLFGMTSIFQTAALSFTPILFGVVAFSIDRPAELTKLFHEFAWLFFVTPVCWWPFTMLPIIVAAFRADAPRATAFPRWFGWFTFFDLILAEAGVIALVFKSGPFAWNGIFPFWLPFCMYGPWTAALIYCLLRAIRLQGERAPELDHPRTAAVTAR